MENCFEFGLKNVKDFTANTVNVISRNRVSGQAKDDVFETALVVSFSKRLKKLGSYMAVVYDTMDIRTGTSYIKWPDFAGTDVVYICSVSYSADKHFNSLKTKFLESVNVASDNGSLEYKYAGTPSVFLSQNGAPVLCFVDEFNHNVVIFHSSNDWSGVHRSASMLSVLCPWLFREEKPTEDEMKFLKAMSDGDIALCAKLFTDFVDSNENREITIKKCLTGFKSSTLDKKIATLGYSIAENNSTVNDLLQKIRELTVEIEWQNVEYNSLVDKRTNEGFDEELFKFLSTNRSIHVEEKLVYSSYTAINFTVESTLDLVDENMFEKYISFGRSELLINESYSREQMRDFFRALWETRKFKVRVWAAYEIDSNANLLARTKIQRPRFLKNALPQPHIVHAGCFGSYANYNAQNAADKNVIGAFMTSVSVTKSLNLSDSYIVRLFKNDLLKTIDSHEAVIETRDGRIINLQEAMAIIEKEGIE